MLVGEAGGVYKIKFYNSSKPGLWIFLSMLEM